MPVPILFLTMEPRPNIPVLSIDNYAGGVLATQHLLDQGCKNIAHLSGPLDWREARQRKKAWQETLAKAGHKFEERFSDDGNWSTSGGQAAFQQLKENYPKMDAVFVANDQMALCVLRTACETGIRDAAHRVIAWIDEQCENAIQLGV